MALAVTHTTAADASFSAAGATAWNAGHTITGEFDPAAPGAIGGTTAAAITGTTITATTAFNVPYSTTAPTIFNSAAPTTGFGIFDANNISLYVNDAKILAGSNPSSAAGSFRVQSTGAFAFSSSVANNTAADTWITRYAAKQLMISGDGIGAATNAGLILGYGGASGQGLLDASTAGLLWLGKTNAVGIQIGGGMALTLTAGAIGLPKMTASASAPGATGAKFEVVAGTNAGTAKLIMYAGTSTTATTIVDNVGAGVS